MYSSVINANDFYSPFYVDTRLEKDIESGLRTHFSEWETTVRQLRELAPIYRDLKSGRTVGGSENEILQHWNEAAIEWLGYEDATEEILELIDGSTISGCRYVRDDNSNESPYLLVGPMVNTDEGLLETLCPGGLHDDGTVLTLEQVVGGLFRQPERRRRIIVLCGRYLALFDSVKWGDRRYLVFDWDALFGPMSNDDVKLILGLLHRRMLVGSAASHHEDIEEASRRHAAGVSDDLKYTAREAVELLGQEYVEYCRRTHRRYLDEEGLAEQLTADCLRYVYRILFLLYVESRDDDLEIVPMKSEEYRTAYSLEALRDLELQPLVTEEARNGTYFHDSLERLFQLMNEGEPPYASTVQSGLDFDQGEILTGGFRLFGLRSWLFDRASTPHLSSIKIRNFVLQRILQKLSLSKGGKNGRERISYAQLSTNDLGSIYEGLLSYSGFFASEPLIEVKRAADKVDELKQTWFVPERDADALGLKPEEFVLREVDGVTQRVRYDRGTFIFRLRGRERTESASYYTPSKLTEAVVKHTLSHVLEGLSADEVLDLTVLEPAMGSGAFLNAAIDRLANAYMEKKEAELSEKGIAPLKEDERRKELAHVRAYIAAKRVYGVDKNELAVELAGVSLWLNTLHAGQSGPWYEARMAVGNSLVGAWRSVFGPESLKDGSWMSQIPERVSEAVQGVYHFLLPHKNMCNYGDKVIKQMRKDSISMIREWKRGFRDRLDAKQVARLVALSIRIDELWERAIAERIALLHRVDEKLSVWPNRQEDGEINPTSISERKDQLSTLQQGAHAPYRIVRMILDIWCSLWYWPLNMAQELPSHDEWIDAVEDLLSASSVESPSVEEVVEDHGWLKTVLSISNREKFHHWELVFGEVFMERGGFDLVLGNPPWVTVTWQEGDLLSDFDPLIGVRDDNASTIADKRATILSDPRRSEAYVSTYESQAGLSEFLSAEILYPELSGSRPNLYKNFISQSWRVGSDDGVTGLLHQEGVFDELNGGGFRTHIYPRLLGHYQFINEKQLFKDVSHTRRYSMNIYRARPGRKVFFEHMSNLFTPETIDWSMVHHGYGPVPGYKTLNNEWETRGHSHRIVRITSADLQLLASVFGDGNTDNPLEQPLPSVHSEEIMSILKRLSDSTSSLQNSGVNYDSSTGWNETTDVKERRVIKVATPIPSEPGTLIIKGPHIYVGNPIFKSPNDGCKNNHDYTSVDLLSVPDDYLPRTNFISNVSNDEYIGRTQRFNGTSFLDYYRLAHRNMASISGERTLITAIIPPRVAHIHGIRSLAMEDLRTMTVFAGVTASIVADGFVKITGKDNVFSALEQLPLPTNAYLSQRILSRALRLNCLTIYYKELWETLFDSALSSDGFVKSDSRLPYWSQLTPIWNREASLRTDFERRQALVELDALVALAYGFSEDELLTLYRTYFAVLQKNERIYQFYDTHGRIVPMDVVRARELEFQIQAGEATLPRGKALIAYHEALKKDYPPVYPGTAHPYDQCDREEDMRQAYRAFAKQLREATA